MVETRHLVLVRRPCAVLGWMSGLDHEKEARRRGVEAGQQKCAREQDARLANLRLFGVGARASAYKSDNGR